jgi:hypothetical protein
MTIENLVKVLPPPEAPISAFAGPWMWIEKVIGTALPQDYKDFTRLYGFGTFLEFFGVYSPVCRSPHVRLEPQILAMRGFTSQLDDSPYSMWPKPGGLLPCGVSDFGDYLFWRTDGPPQSWRVVFWGRGMCEFEAFDCDLTDFLAGIVTGKIWPNDFPERLDEEEALFTPEPDTWPDQPSAD